jgi:uncharacterized membrane protein
MNWKRLWRHAITDRGSVTRAFPERVLDRIEREIGDAERAHGGQVLFVVEAALPLARVFAGLSPRQRALEVFGLARAWDTAENNGVLVYLLLADHDVEIVADRGIHARVGDAGWQAICATMEAQFRGGHFEDGALAGIDAVSRLLLREYPRTAEGSNELPNRPLVL